MAVIEQANLVDARWGEGGGIDVVIAGEAIVGRPNDADVTVGKHSDVT